MDSLRTTEAHAVEEKGCWRCCGCQCRRRGRAGADGSCWRGEADGYVLHLSARGYSDKIETVAATGNAFAIYWSLADVQVRPGLVVSFLSFRFTDRLVGYCSGSCGLKRASRRSMAD
jgi:hypothetical protein